MPPTPSIGEMPASISTSSTLPENAGAPEPQAFASVEIETSARPPRITPAQRVAAAVNAACCDEVIDPLMRTVTPNASEGAAPTVTVLVRVTAGAMPSDTRSPIVRLDANVADRIELLVQPVTETS